MLITVGSTKPPHWVDVDLLKFRQVAYTNVIYFMIRKLNNVTATHLAGAAAS